MHLTKSGLFINVIHHNQIMPDLPGSLSQKPTLDPQLRELSEKARREGKEYGKKRWIYPKIKKHVKERIYIALVGPRGAGKSVILKQIHAEAPDSFYLSLDNFIPSPDLYSFAKELEGSGTSLLLLDEVHRYPNWGHELKKIYDFLPAIKIIFTSSSAISLHGESYDLSRRARLIPVHPFSFREYLSFSKGDEYEPLEWESLLDLELSRTFSGRTVHAEVNFGDFLQGGNYPFAFMDRERLPLFSRMLETIITEDLVGSSRLTLEESQEVRRMLSFIGRSPIDGISYSSISKNIGITKFKAQKYVDLMEKAFVLMRVAPKGTNVSKEPKILFMPPYRLLYRQYEECIGALREDFFVDAALRLGVEFSYLKGGEGEKMPDYVLNGIICEIGGAGKSRSQFKGFSAKKKIIFTQPGMIDDMRRPLFFVGMLEEKSEKW